LLIGLSLLIALCCSAVARAQAPVLPHAFYGAVQTAGIPAAVGSQVEARGAGVLVNIAGNPVIIEQAGEYGGAGPFVPKLVVQGNIADGTLIVFYVDGALARCATPGGSWLESYPFKSGDVTQLDLSVAPQSNGRRFLPIITIGG
jgi:hypothetical protein